jgi:hypothetical protein
MSKIRYDKNKENVYTLARGGVYDVMYLFDHKMTSPFYTHDVYQVSHLATFGNVWYTISVLLCNTKYYINT